MIAVRFEHVTKSFSHHAGQKLLRERLKHYWRKRDTEPFQALADVSFAVDAGTSVGIVGHNGAGKSTILNLITRLCLPTAGRVEVNGKVAALLDLGAGFHPDLTGAENVRINASLVGLTRRQVARQFDVIVDFAEIQGFINEPLRTYSSGMVMRLAFAIAVHVNADILVIDEVLGVGDQGFLNKSARRLEEFQAAGGTMICVSHALESVRSLCSRVIWLDHGRVVRDGPVNDVLAAYRRTSEGLEHAAVSR